MKKSRKFGLIGKNIDYSFSKKCAHARHKPKAKSINQFRPASSQNKLGLIYKTETPHEGQNVYR